MVFSKATLAPAPSIPAPLDLLNGLFETQGAETDSDRQPAKHYVYGSHTMCPVGLSSGLSHALRLPKSQAHGLVTPGIGYMGHFVLKFAVMGRRHHFLGIVLGVYERYLVVKVQRLCSQTY
jgi:hypothetical protein